MEVPQQIAKSIGDHAIHKRAREQINILHHRFITHKPKPEPLSPNSTCSTSMYLGSYKQSHYDCDAPITIGEGGI